MVRRQCLPSVATHLISHKFENRAERARLYNEKKAGRAGRKPRLSGAQFKQIEHALKRGPQALGYATGLWTASRVRELIEDRCGVRYHQAHVWRILRQLGWSCQRPSGRALERDEVAIRYRKRVGWPRIKKKRAASGAPSSLSTRAG
jgi:transposase